MGCCKANSTHKKQLPPTNSKKPGLNSARRIARHPARTPTADPHKAGSGSRAASNRVHAATHRQHAEKNSKNSRPNTICTVQHLPESESN